MKYFSQVLLFGGLLLCGDVVPSHNLYAANEQGGLTVNPAFQEIVLDKKDGEKSFSVSLTNETNAPMTLRLVLYDFGNLDESGGVAFLGASNDLAKKYALASWMRPEKEIVVIGQGETTKVLVTIENSDLLSPGGHYGALMFQVGDDTGTMIDAPAKDISVKQMFSSLIFVKKVGGEIYGLALNGQEYESNIVKFQDVIRLRFQNSGNVHLVPRGVVVVTDPLGRTVAKGIINQESALILPETLRVYPVRLSALAASFIPGRYTMEIAYRYDGKDDFATTSLQFDFIPPVAIVIVLALVAAFGWYAIRRRRHMGERKALSGSGKSSNKDV